MTGDIVTKSVVSVTEMAKMVGLSRARFYQLVRKGTFPTADEDSLSKRPCYGEGKQRQILEARRRNCGCDGKPILFYSRRRDLGQSKTAARPAKQSKITPFIELIDGLAALNLNATVAQIEPIVKELFPSGFEGVDRGEVIKAVFLRIQRQNPTDRLGR